MIQIKIQAEKINFHHFKLSVTFVSHYLNKSRNNKRLSINGKFGDRIVNIEFLKRKTHHEFSR
jgi:hypothetical protein